MRVDLSPKYQMSLLINKMVFFHYQNNILKVFTNAAWIEDVVYHVVWEHNLQPCSIKLLLFYAAIIYFSFILLKNMLDMWK